MNGAGAARVLSGRQCVRSRCVDKRLGRRKLRPGNEVLRLMAAFSSNEQLHGCVPMCVAAGGV